MRKALKIIIYISFIALVIGYIELPPPNENFNFKGGYKWERYDPSLSLRLNTVDDIVAYADSAIGKDKRHSLDYVRQLSRTISDCFYHGYSYYSFHHNWIAYLGGNLVWSDLDAIVDANDILKHPNAACSQVSIVLAACLKKVGISYRKVGLNGHFVLEAGLDNKWYIFDPNLEPQFPNGRKSLAELMKANELYAGYKDRLTVPAFERVFSRIEYGKPNEPLAPHALLFHKITFCLSIAIALFLLIYVSVDISKWVYARLTNRNNSKLSRVEKGTIAIRKKVTFPGSNYIRIGKNKRISKEDVPFN